MVDRVPFPFTSREQYERAMRNPLGAEWNTGAAFANLTRPDVTFKMGQLIDPIKLSKAAKIKWEEQQQAKVKAKRDARKPKL